MKNSMITYNVNGMRDNTKRRDVYYFLHRNKFDIMFLQETHSDRSVEKFWSSQWGSKIWFAHGESNARGVAILFSKKLKVVVHNAIVHEDGRYIILYVTLENMKLLLVNTYTPNRDSPSFFRDLSREIDRFSPDSIIWGGDMNLAMNLVEDRQGSFINNDQAAKVVNKYVESKSLIDVWRYLHPDEHGFTWRKMKPKPSFSRLDYIFVSNTFEQYLDSIQVIPGFRSDHSIVKLQVVIVKNKHGPGYWKFNTSLLQALTDFKLSFIRYSGVG